MDIYIVVSIYSKLIEYYELIFFNKSNIHIFTFHLFRIYDKGCGKYIVCLNACLSSTIYIYALFIEIPAQIKWYLEYVSGLEIKLYLRRNLNKE